MKPAERCPQCQRPVEFPDQRYCSECGAELRVSPERSLVAPATSDSTRTLPRLQVLPPHRSLREIYFELGIALCDAGRHQEAVKAFEQAGREPGELPTE